MGQTLNLDTITSWDQRVAGLPGQHARPDHGDPVVTKDKNNDPRLLHARGGLHLRRVDPDDHLAGDGLPKDTKVSFDWLIDPNNGPCGQLPANSSAMCVITRVAELHPRRRTPRRDR